MSRLARNSIAAGLTTLLITTGMSFAANGAANGADIVAQSEASAITATGLTGIVNTKKCRAESTGAPTSGSGTCGTGLQTSGIGVFEQTASTGLDGDNGTSKAAAKVVPINTPTLTTIDPSTLEADLNNIDTGTILDGIVEGLDPVTGQAFQTLLTPLLDQIQAAAIAPLTAALQKQLPVSVKIGAVTSRCTAEAGEDATGASKVASVDILVKRGDGTVITTPVTLKTDSNSPLVGSVATSQLVAGALKGVEDSLNKSLDGVLAPLAATVPTVKKQVVDAVLAQIGPNVVDPLGDALTPILTGTVNKQESGDGAIAVTALSLGVVGKTATLDLARVSCGPNAVRQAADGDGGNAAADGNGNGDADGNNNGDADGNNNGDADGNDNGDADGNDNGAADGNNNGAAAGNGGNAASISDADSAADADASTNLPDAGAPNVLPFVLLGLALLAFGAAVLLNERRRPGSIGPDHLA